MLKGRVAVITGSTSGIGEGIARILAKHGCSLMLNGFGETEAIENQRSELARISDAEVLYNGADLSHASQCIDLIRDAEGRLGRVDILINNAGLQYIAPIEDFPPDRWDYIMAVNLSASFHTIRKTLPLMRRSGWGRVINIASTHGLVASAGKAAYVAAKHGLIGLTKVVALETAGSGVTCNAICPGWVLTPLVQDQIDTKAASEEISNEEATRKLLSEKQPSGAFTTVEQIGSLALYLCTENASNITGAAIPMDGGWLAQ
ncbi:MAG TPA: 3-hydroxybutyrate dehydrogenase [Alloacidobacterium sp.]|jgi:3-hydroxybutyrate dehydrogenase|nr:3-hydroxybutyrate dehydrogenase [Alloacidobacterium sp.]